MVSWFKKYDLITLKNADFLSDIYKIRNEIPKISDLEDIDSPTLDERSQIWDQAIALSATDYENLLQKVLIKLINILISFFRSEYFVQENHETIDFCKRSYLYLTIERKYFLSIWNKQNALHSNFLMNRLLSSYIRFLFYMQSFHKFLLAKNGLIFIEAEPSQIALNYDNIYAILDCLSTLFTSLLQKLSHLKNFLQNELNFLLRIYFFVNYFKTLSVEQNLLNSKQKFSDNDLENLIYLILDTTKTAVVVQRSLLSTEKFFEFEDEFEEDQNKNVRAPFIIEKKESENSHEKHPALVITQDTIETPSKNHQGLGLQRQMSSNVFKKSKMVNQKSYFFDELNGDSKEFKDEDESNEKPLNPILNVKGPAQIRKSLLGDTRKSLIAEALATDEFHKKMSKFAEKNEKKPLVIETPTSVTSKTELFDNSLPRSGIVRSLGETVSNVSKYLNLINPNSSPMKSPIHDKDSIMQSNFFAQSMNLPSKTILSSIHPSIIYYKGTSSTNDHTNELQRQDSKLGNISKNYEGFNENLVKSLSNMRAPNFYDQDGFNYYNDLPRNQKFENINQNLNENLVKYLMDFAEEKKPLKEDKEGSKNPAQLKKDNNKKKNLFVKELEGDSLFPLMTKGDEDSPKNNARRTLSGKKDKELRKQHTLDKEEDGHKHKRKSQKMNTKKLGITEKDLIKIDKNTKIKEDLIYVSFQEKIDDEVPRDEDILVTTLTSEHDDDLKKIGLASTNSFVRSFNSNILKDKDSKQEKKMDISEIKPHYRLSSGVKIPFFIKTDAEDLNESKWIYANKVLEEALNDMEVCEEYNDFFLAPRKKDKRI